VLEGAGELGVHLVDCVLQELEGVFVLVLVTSTNFVLVRAKEGWKSKMVRGRKMT
jgi:hypothetical protein